jgi:hypothetical protein
MQNKIHIAYGKYGMRGAQRECKSDKMAKT